MKPVIDFFAGILETMFGGFLNDALGDNLTATMFFAFVIGVVIAILILKREFSKNPKIPQSRWDKDKLFRNIAYLKQYRWDFSAIRDEEDSIITPSQKNMVNTYRETLKDCERLTGLGEKRDSFYHFRRAILHSTILIFAIYSFMTLLDVPQLDIFTALPANSCTNYIVYLLIISFIISRRKKKNPTSKTPKWMNIIRLLLWALLSLTILFSVGNIVPYAEMENPTAGAIAGLSLIAFVFMILIKDRLMFWMVMFPTLMQYEPPTQYQVTEHYESIDGGAWNYTGSTSTALNGTGSIGFLFLIVFFLFKLLLLFIYVFFSGISLLFSQSILLVAQIICGFAKSMKKKDEEKDEMTKVQEYLGLESALY